MLKSLILIVDKLNKKTDSLKQDNRVLYQQIDYLKKEYRDKFGK